MSACPSVFKYQGLDNRYSVCNRIKWSSTKSRQGREMAGQELLYYTPHINTQGCKSTTTSKMFCEYFISQFVPELKEYCEKENLSFIILILLDNAPDHPTSIQDQTWRLCFFHPTTTSLIEPMDQGVVDTFKACYLPITFINLVESTDNNQMIVKEFWKAFNNKGCSL